jgi:hypothetical protein
MARYGLSFATVCFAAMTLGLCCNARARPDSFGNDDAELTGQKTDSNSRFNDDALEETRTMTSHPSSGLENDSDRGLGADVARSYPKTDWNGNSNDDTLEETRTLTSHSSIGLKNYSNRGLNNNDDNVYFRNALDKSLSLPHSVLKRSTDWLLGLGGGILSAEQIRKQQEWKRSQWTRPPVRATVTKYVPTYDYSWRRVTFMYVDSSLDVVVYSLWFWAASTALLGILLVSLVIAICILYKEKRAQQQVPRAPGSRDWIGQKVPQTV